MKTVRDIAIARSGDKGDRATLTVIARDPAHYPLLEHVLTAERVRQHYRATVHGEVVRYLLPHLGAVHFTLHDALGGGVTRSLALQVLAQRLKVIGLDRLERRAELIGVDAMHGDTLGAGRTPYEVRARLAVRCATREQAERVGQEVEAMYLNGPAGGGGVTQQVREVIAAASALVPREAARSSVQVLTL